MPFTISNLPASPTAEQIAQSGVDTVDVAIMTGGDGVTAVMIGIGGQCAVTSSGSGNGSVVVASGTVRIGGRKVVVAGNTVALTANASGNPRFDVISVPLNGTAVATAGTPATNPVFPAVPATSIGLATVWVPNGFTTSTTIGAADIVDKRIVTYDPGFENVVWYGADPTGVADSTAAYLAARNAIATSGTSIGGVIYTPNGTFLMNGTAPNVPTGTAAAAAAGGSLTAGTYHYRVSARTAAGETQGTADFTGTTSGGNLTLNLTWNASTGTGISVLGYNVYRSTTASNWTLLAQPATNSYSDTGAVALVGFTAPVQAALSASTTGGVLPTGTFFAQVTAYNNNGETIASNEQSVATTGPTASVTVSWAAPVAPASAVTGYRVYWSHSAIGGGGTGTEGYWAETGSTSMTVTGQLQGKSAYPVLGIPPRYNETGWYPSFSLAGGTAVIGLQIPPSYQALRIVGTSAIMGNLSGSPGSTVQCGTTDMTMFCFGDGATLNQGGPSLEYKNIVAATGCTGVVIASCNHCSFINVGDKNMYVSYKLTASNAADCSWHQFVHCTCFNSTRYALDLGDCVGLRWYGGDFELGANAIGVYLHSAQSCKFFGAFFDGSTVGGIGHSVAVASKARPGPLSTGSVNVDGGGIGNEFHGCKYEGCGIAIDLDSSGNNGQGRGNKFYGGTVSPTGTAEIGVFLRSANMQKTGLTGITNLATGADIIDLGANTTVVDCQYQFNVSPKSVFDGSTLTINAGTQIKGHLSAVSTSWSPGAISANTTSAAKTVTVTGANVGDTVFAGYSAALAAGLVLTAWVSSANTVSCTISNVSAGSLTPTASSTVRVDVWQH